MGATVITKDLDRPRRISRHLRIMTGTVKMSTAYAAGGDGFDPIPGATYLQVDVESVGGYMFEFDKTNKKLKVICPSGGTAPTADVAPTLAATGTPTMSGADSATITTHTHAGSAITGGRGIEMGGTPDLSTLVARYRALAKV